MPNTAPITKAENDALLKELLADLEVRGAQYQQYLVDEMVKQAGGVKNPPLQVAAKEALPSFKEVNVMVKDKALVGAAGVHYVAFHCRREDMRSAPQHPGLSLRPGARFLCWMVLPCRRSCTETPQSVGHHRKQPKLTAKSTPPRPGFCDTCGFARVIESARSSRFTLCRRSETDARFARYPALPVLECAGYEKGAPDARPNEAPGR